MRNPAIKVLVLLLLAFGACNKKSDASASSSDTSASSSDTRSVIKVAVDAAGFHPSEAKAKAGKPVRIEVTRTTDEGCGQQLVFPTLDIKKDLPLNQPVNVDVTMPTSGKLAFTCGMDMYRGAIVAE